MPTVLRSALPHPSEAELGPRTDTTALPPVSESALGWRQAAVQLAALILGAVAGGDADEEAMATRQTTSAQTSALPD